MTTYNVSLDAFRGPLDLLLYLVKKQEVDILDIPIAPITEQFLETLTLMQLLDVELAGDFIVMASTLMEIKSKLLLPEDAPEEGREAPDPRRELVRQLIEYRKFKDAAGLLEGKAEEQSSRVPREPPPEPAGAKTQQPVRPVELWDLVSAFGRLMRETLSLQPRQIVVDDTPQHIYQAMILARLEREDRIAFRDLFEPPYERARLIGIFLATLELIKGREITLEQAEPFGEIWIVRGTLASQM